MDRLESDYYAFCGHDPARSRAALAHYVRYLSEGPVLELGCGHGELLGLLREAGVEARGVDADPGMVQAAQAAGHDVVLDDVLSHLARLGADSLRGVVSAHLVEHLEPPTVESLLRECARVVQPGGVVVTATPNAGSQSVLGHDFWRDPTHVRPYDVQLLAFLCDRAGLEVVEVGENPGNAPGPPPGAVPPQVVVEPELRTAVDEAVARLARRRSRREDAETTGHLLGVLADRLQATQQQLADLTQSYGQLLERLYPSNEVYVVARAR
jgi:SAM-dependent methyltransferase